MIGRGRSGTVFLARHLGLDEERAIKRVRRTESGFIQEAALLKRLRHPGIPIIYDLEIDENYYYLIEEYLCGEKIIIISSRNICAVSRCMPELRERAVCKRESLSVWELSFAGS